MPRTPDNPEGERTPQTSMEIHVRHDHYIHSAGEESLLTAINRKVDTMTDKIDDLGTAEAKQIELTEQLLTQARASATNLQDVQQQLAAALEGQANDPRIQGLINQANAEIGNLMGFLSPSPVPEPPVPGA